MESEDYYCKRMMQGSSFQLLVILVSVEITTTIAGLTSTSMRSLCFRFAIESARAFLTISFPKAVAEVETSAIISLGNERTAGDTGD